VHAQKGLSLSDYVSEKDDYNVITILNGKFKDVLLPRIPMIPTDMPFD
jgi:hypothetical protein